MSHVSGEWESKCNAAQLSIEILQWRVPDALHSEQQVTIARNLQGNQSDEHLNELLGCVCGVIPETAATDVLVVTEDRRGQTKFISTRFLAHSSRRLASLLRGDELQMNSPLRNHLAEDHQFRGGDEDQPKSWTHMELVINKHY